MTSGMPLLFSSDQLAHYPKGIAARVRRKGKPLRKAVRSTRSPRRFAVRAGSKKVQGQSSSQDRPQDSFSGTRREWRKYSGRSPVSRKINTAYVERGNGSIRHLNARCNRKTLRFSKLKQNHVRQLRLSLAYYHFCRPHRTLTRRFGNPTTPFMAGSLTDHVWSMEELLNCKVKIQSV